MIHAYYNNFILIFKHEHTLILHMWIAKSFL